MRDKNSEENSTSIEKRLNILISLFLEQAPLKSVSITDKIIRLKAMGLSPSEIGEIVGKKANYVSAVLGSHAKPRKVME